MFNPLNAELNPICHLLALLGGATIVVVSRFRVNFVEEYTVIVITAVINLSVTIWCARVEKFSVSLEIILSPGVHASCK